MYFNPNLSKKNLRHLFLYCKIISRLDKSTLFNTINLNLVLIQLIDCYVTIMFKKNCFEIVLLDLGGFHLYSL